jgi:hypothetical protein
MRGRDPSAALLAVSGAVPDWSGGTRLGELMKAFLDRGGQRGLARGAVVPPLVDGLRIEDLAWALMWRMLDTVAERDATPFAAYFHQDCLEAAALIRVSRTLNDGRPAQIFIRDGVGGVRELRVVNRADPSVVERVLRPGAGEG